MGKHAGPVEHHGPHPVETMWFTSMTPEEKARDFDRYDAMIRGER